MQFLPIHLLTHSSHPNTGKKKKKEYIPIIIIEMDYWEKALEFFKSMFLTISPRSKTLVEGADEMGSQISGEMGGAWGGWAWTHLNQLGWVYWSNLGEKPPQNETERQLTNSSLSFLPQTSQYSVTI